MKGERQGGEGEERGREEGKRRWRWQRVKRDQFGERSGGEKIGMMWRGKEREKRK